MASTSVTVPSPDGDGDIILNLLLFQYAGEPCRICRQLLTVDDIKEGAKFAGYSVDGTARAAHRVCWQNFVELVQTLPREQVYRLMDRREP